VTNSVHNVFMSEGRIRTPRTVWLHTLLTFDTVSETHRNVDRAHF